MAAVQAGNHELSAVKSCTKAGTGCGGCSNLLSSRWWIRPWRILGVEADKGLCEHFAYGRQRAPSPGPGRRAEELRGAAGQSMARGLGCDICQPTVASILASLWNEHVLEKPHRALQDTNDAFLANLQKDGTYSVVPRMPGITPEGLITIGEVARKYGLYTKITGGQRIDLVRRPGRSAARHLGRAGGGGASRPGQAYGRVGCRTVKSLCGSRPGARYGVQDSMTLAQTLEQPLPGLRAPHKLKFAVSGCTRSAPRGPEQGHRRHRHRGGAGTSMCAGSGGMRPRIADLFATDLDEQTLIRYIDRLLMFLCAHRGQAATHLGLDGEHGRGLDYLRSSDHRGQARHRCRSWKP